MHLENRLDIEPCLLLLLWLLLIWNTKYLAYKYKNVILWVYLFVWNLKLETDAKKKKKNCENTKQNTKQNQIFACNIEY